MDGDVLFSSTGKRQLEFQGTRQPADFQTPSVKKVLCSPLRRAILTALAAYPNHKITLDPRLRECSAGGGMTVGKLRAWIKKVRPDRLADVDFSRLPRGVWWGAEEKDETDSRLQSVLAALGGRAKTGVWAFVGHSIAFRSMAGCPIRPFPKLWGTQRSWPKNFKPYFANAKRKAGKWRLGATTPKSAGVVLVRHAHSSRQAARTAQKKKRKAAAAFDDQHQAKKVPKAKRAPGAKMASPKATATKGLPPAARVLQCTDKTPTSGFILQRCKKANGRSIGSVVGNMYYKDSAGQRQEYRASDLRYDLNRGFLRARRE